MFLHPGKKYVLTAAIILVCATTAFTQGARWSKAAPFPEPDEELYGMTVNGKMYVLGGFGTARGKNYEYDPASDKWTKKAAMPRPAHHQSMVEYQGKIYVFGGFVAPMSGPQGGWEPIDNAWVYDPANDSWRNLAPMPIKRGSAAANIVNGKVYVMGGATTPEGSKDIAISNATTANNLVRNDVYDIASNTWSSGAPMRIGYTIPGRSCMYTHIVPRAADRYRRGVRPRDQYVGRAEGKDADGAERRRLGDLWREDLRRRRRDCDQRARRRVPRRGSVRPGHQLVVDPAVDADATPRRGRRDDRQQVPPGERHDHVSGRGRRAGPHRRSPRHAARRAGTAGGGN